MQSDMKKIVLIEDNLNVRESTKEILELADYQVYEAENGKKGVELVKSQKPDLVLCDIMMPNLDGYGVLRILSQNPDTSHIPFIFLTAKIEKSDLRKGMNLGADDYITKPFEETDLLEAIDVRLKKSSKLKKEFQADLNGLNEFLKEAKGLEELENLSADRKLRNYKKKEVIYREDDIANFLYFISKGKVKCFKTDEYGKDFVNNIHYPGEFIGYTAILESSRHKETAKSMEHTEVALIPKQDFLSLIQKNRDVSSKFIKMLSGNVSEREKRLLQLAYTPLRERIASILLEIMEQERIYNTSTSTMTISREDLAGMVGTAKESLNRMISEFKNEGLIDTKGQDIQLLDENGLKKAAAAF